MHLTTYLWDLLIILFIHRLVLLPGLDIEIQNITLCFVTARMEIGYAFDIAVVDIVLFYNVPSSLYQMNCQDRWLTVMM